MRQFRHDGETRIKLERIERPAIVAGDHGFEQDMLRHAVAIIVARKPVAALVGEAAEAEEDELVFGDACGARLCQRRDDDRRALVHVRVGDHALCVGPGDVAVVSRGRGDVCRGERLRQPCVWIFRCDF